MLKWLLCIVTMLFVSCGGVKSPQGYPDKPMVEIVASSIEKPDTEETLSDSLKRQKQEALATIATYHAKIDAIDAVMKQTEIDAVNKWSKIVSWACLVLSISLAVLSFFTIQYPILRKVARTSSLCLGVLATIGFTIPIIYPYLIMLGFLSLGILLFVGIRSWVLDRSALVGVVNCVEENKSVIKDYRSKFKKYINATSDDVINRIRSKIQHPDPK